MSAAEKLGALETGRRADLLWLALPQIVAVVEAAERERSPHHADYWTSEKDCPLCAALAALDEALS